MAGGATGVFTKKGTGNSPVTGSSSNSPTAGVDFDASHSHDVTGNTGDQGGTMGQAYNNLPPYYALAYIIHYAQGGDAAKGQKGEIGATGPTGPSGPTGPTGPAGSSGSATISNNADNRVITGGTGSNLNGYHNLSFD